MSERPNQATGGVRKAHDPGRRAVSTAIAATRLNRSRYQVAEDVRLGALPGYGIPADKRTRWYVYEDTLPSEGPADDSYVDAVAQERDHYRAEAAALRETLLRVLASNDNRRLAEKHRDASIRLLAEAVTRASQAAEASRASDEALEEALRQIVLPRLVP